MFVHRTRGVATATLLGVLSLAAAACDDPAQNTDLRPEGPPEVLAVLVMTDAAGQLVEQATYCKPNDEKRPSLVGLPDFTTQQVCPVNLSETVDTVDSAYPDGWYVRIMFDELLNGDVETLTEVIDPDTGEATDTYVGSIATTHPVKLECKNLAGAMVEVDYDGYYSPSGNRITWPVGPSLVIKPNDPTLIATNADCQVTILDVVTDKAGEAVPAGDRGPYKFTVAGIQVLAIDPPDDEEGTTPIDATQIYFDNVYIQFNTFVDIESMCVSNPLTGLCASNVFEFKDVEHPTEGPGYCNTTLATCSTLADCGTGDTLCGKGYCGNGDFDTPCNVDTDCTAPDVCESTYAYSLAPFGLSEAEFGFGPVNPIETERSYTFGFVNGTKIKDRCGRETTLTASVDDQTLVHFTTNPFAYKTATIATGETASPLKKLKLTFTNVVGGGDAPGAVLPATTLDPTMWSISPEPIGTPPSTPFAHDQGLIVATDASGQPFLRGHFQLDTEYTFTLKAGAVIKDFYGATYTNAMDKVITWKTQPKITASFTADNTVFTKASATSLTGVTITFNQSIPTTDLASPATRTTTELTEGTEFTVTDGSNNPVTGLTIDTSANSSCTTSSTSCAVRIRKNLAAGDYTFTLKAGATVNDVLGNVYTQAADKVVHFTVEDPAPPAPTCL
jgi:hypothetical protein